MGAGARARPVRGRGSRPARPRDAPAARAAGTRGPQGTGRGQRDRAGPPAQRHGRQPEARASRGRASRRRSPCRHQDLATDRILYRQARGRQARPLTSAGRPEGVPRYEAPTAECPLRLDVTEGAVLATTLEGGATCTFTAADCATTPVGMWGPAPASLTRARVSSTPRGGVADKAVRDNYKLMTQRARSEDVRPIVAEQAAFSADREQFCRAYAREGVHGFCHLRYTENRALALATRLGANTAAPTAATAVAPAPGAPPEARGGGLNRMRGRASGRTRSRIGCRLHHPCDEARISFPRAGPGRRIVSHPPPRSLTGHRPLPPDIPILRNLAVEVLAAHEAPRVIASVAKQSRAARRLQRGVSLDCFATLAMTEMGDDLSGQTLRMSSGGRRGDCPVRSLTPARRSPRAWPDRSRCRAGCARTWTRGRR